MATTKKKAFDLDKLIKWLESSNGHETFIFETSFDMSVNLSEARNFAESMRMKIGLSRAVSVEQSYNKVTLSLVEVGALSG